MSRTPKSIEGNQKSSRELDDEFLTRLAIADTWDADQLMKARTRIADHGVGHHPETQTRTAESAMRVCGLVAEG
ncbi:hypothetical protein [Nocardia nepalensis]|uniref:hypothetical protein n=1 Tax=Nocardia nepalensis TaxID=3375448 RepID=UPI003B6800EE